jgi:hypothetical protein
MRPLPGLTVATPCAKPNQTQLHSSIMNDQWERKIKPMTAFAPVCNYWWCSSILKIEKSNTVSSLSWTDNDGHVLENDTKVGSEMDKGSRQSGRAKEILHFFAKPGPVTVKVHQKSRSLFFFYSVQYGSDSSPKELIFFTVPSPDQNHNSVNPEKKSNDVSLNRGIKTIMKYPLYK